MTTTISVNAEQFEDMTKKAETIARVLHSLAIEDETLLHAHQLACEVVVAAREMEKQS